MVNGVQESSVASAAATAATNKFWGNDNTLHLGVIVDRTDFDGEDDLKDIPQVFDDEQRGAMSDSEGVVVKRGKVRRKLRWKPKGFRKKKKNQNTCIYWRKN